MRVNNPTDAHSTAAASWDKEAERGKKQIAEDVLVLHGYVVRGKRGGGLTASRGGKYVATFDQKKPTQVTATSKCPRVAALVFNLFKGGEPKHKLKFAELAVLGLGQGQLEQQAAALVDAARARSARKQLAEAAVAAAKAKAAA
jgi:hypothetical protein